MEVESRLCDRAVPRVGYGCMGLSEFYAPVSESEAVRAMRAAWEAGVRHFDTADMYGLGDNERLVGQFARSLGEQRAELLIATKVGIRRSRENPRQMSVDSSPSYVTSACEASLARLGLERIDLLYLHRKSADVPIEDTVGAMQRLRERGLIGGIGLSEVSAKTLERASSVCRIDALQNEYSLWTRDAERDLLAICSRESIAFVAYSPLGRGFFAGISGLEVQLERKEDLRHVLPRFASGNLPRNAELLCSLEEVAARYQSSTSRVALAWVLARRPFVHVIPGSRRPEHIRDNTSSLALKLSTEDESMLTQAFAPERVLGQRYPEALLSTVNS